MKKLLLLTTLFVLLFSGLSYSQNEFTRAEMDTYIDTNLPSASAIKMAVLRDVLHNMVTTDNNVTDDNLISTEYSEDGDNWHDPYTGADRYVRFSLDQINWTAPVLFLDGTTMDLDTNRIINVSDGVDPLDVVNVQQLEGATGIAGNDSIIYNPISNIVHNEGVTFYDSIKKALSVYTESPEVTHNLGREGLVRSFNGTGQIIPNNTPVYLHEHEFLLASFETFHTSRLVAVTTEEIGVGEWGEATIWGEQSGDFSGFGAGTDIYLGHEELTSTKPTGGVYRVYIGEVQSDTVLFINPTVSPHTAESVSPTGWVDIDDDGFADNVTIEIRNSDRTIKLTATDASTYYHYENGEKYISSVDSFQWSNVEGIHLIFFDGNVIDEILNPTSSQTRMVKERYAGISNIYWSTVATPDSVIYSNNEFHTFDMNGKTKGVFHDIHGCIVIDAIPLTNFSVDGTGNLDVHAQYGNNSGTIRNQDIKTVIPSNVSTVGYPTYYRSGASSWALDAGTTGFAVINTGTGRLAFNENVGGIYQLTEATTNNYVPYYFLTSNTFENRAFVLPGQSQYASAAAAVEGGLQEIQSIFGSMPIKEIAGVGMIIYQTKDSYSNTVKSRIVSVTDPLTGATVNYINLSTSITGGGGDGGGMESVLDDPNGPPSYAGAANKLFGVNNSENGWEFKNITTDASGNTVAEGSVTSPNFISNVITGTQPYATSSITLNTNHNSDLLDSQHGAYYLDLANGTGDSDDIAEGAINLFNQTHIGEVTGSTVLTVANSVIDEQNLDVSNAPTDNFILSYNATGTNFTWIPDDTGISNHSGLSQLDYASAGHTGFAGTGIENTFAANQNITGDLDVTGKAAIGGTNDTYQFNVEGNSDAQLYLGEFKNYSTGVNNIAGLRLTANDRTGYLKVFPSNHASFPNYVQLYGTSGLTNVFIGNIVAGLGITMFYTGNVAMSNDLDVTGTGIFGDNVSIGTTTADGVLTLKNPDAVSENEIISVQSSSSTLSVAKVVYNQTTDAFKFINESAFSGSTLELGTNNSTDFTIDLSGDVSILNNLDVTGGITIGTQAVLDAEVPDFGQVKALNVSTFTNDADYISSVTTLANNQVVTATGDNTADGNAGFTSDGSSIVLAGEIESDESRVQTLGNRTGSLSTSAASGYKATLTLTGNFELFYTDIKDGGEGSIEVLQDGTGGYSFTLSGFGAYTTEQIMGINSEVAQGISEHTTVVYWRSGSTLYYGFIYDN